MPWLLRFATAYSAGRARQVPNSTRYADVLDFAVPSAEEFARAAGMLLRRGYKA